MVSMRLFNMAGVTPRKLSMIGLLFIMLGHSSSGNTASLYPYGLAEGDTDLGNTNPPLPIPVEQHTEWDREINTLSHADGAFDAKLIHLDLWGELGLDLSSNSGSHMFHRSTSDAALLATASDDIAAAFGTDYPYNAFTPAQLLIVTFEGFTYPGGDDTTETNTVQMVLIHGSSRTAPLTVSHPEAFYMVNVGDIGWWKSGSTYPTIGVSYNLDGAGLGFHYYIPGSGTFELENTLPLGNSNITGRWLFHVTKCHTGDCLTVPNARNVIGNNSAPRVAGYTALCKEGYTGAMCQYKATAAAGNDYCDPDPCEFGTCNNWNSSYNCSCEPGYAGKTCDVDIDYCANDPCINGACTDEVDVFRCTCDPGYSGRQCQDNIDDCAGNPCGNGLCIDGLDDYKCICELGDTDSQCAADIHVPECSRDVDIDDCANNPCINGTCTDEVVGFRCICDQGYSGRECQDNIDDCANDPCINGACTDEVDGFRCICDPGYSGRQCQDNIDDCARNPCGNGLCIDGLDDYKCICELGDTDSQCAADIHLPRCLRASSLGLRSRNLGTYLIAVQVMRYIMPGVMV